MTADVVVVGAGVAGASITFHLTRAGFRVIALERRKPASGGTGRSAGLIRLSSPVPELALASLPYFHHWEELIGGRCGFVRCGVAVLVGHQHRDDLAKTAVRLRAGGIRLEMLDGRKLATVVPGWRLEGLTGLIELDSGYASPRLATTSLLRAAGLRGAVVHHHTEVLALRRRGEGITGVQTSAGPIEAACVVLAAGPWTPRLGRTADVNVPIMAQRVQLAVAAGQPWPGPAVLDFHDAVLVRPHRWGTLVGVGTREAEIVDPDTYQTAGDASFLEAAHARLAARAPALAAAPWRYAFAGLYDVTPDGRPLIGQVAPGLMLACGFSGAGFKVAPAVGQAVADLVVRGTTSFDLTPFLPDRPLAVPRAPALAGVPRM